MRAELSATTRDDNLLENAVSLFSAEPKVKAVRWSIQGEAAADWTKRIWLGAGAQPACRGVRSPAQRSECPNSGGPRSVIRDIVVGGCGCVVAVGSRPW